MYTNYKRIRQEAGFYNESEYSPLEGTVDANNTLFFVDPERIGDRIKFVSTFGLSNGQFGVSTNDVRVYCGLSGVYGFSSLGVSAVDALTGAITVATAPASGSSVVATFVSSAVEDDRIKYFQGVAESTIDNVLGSAYELPLEKRVLEVDDLAAKLAAAYLLINNHSANSLDSSVDGFRLLDYVLGLSEASGRIYTLAKQGYMIAEDGTVISATKENGQVTTSNEYVSGYAGGQIFTITQENWRFSQPDSTLATTGASEDNFWGN